MSEEEKKTCFVIAPIGDPESETRKRSDQILRHIIRPAVEACGYEATRADEIDQPGLITSQVIQRVVDDDLVIADLTERNPNVFYELAIRHAIRKPFVQIISEGDSIPFDVAGQRTIFVNHRDLDNVEEAKNAIIDQIGSLEVGSAELDTPISVSLDLQSLRQTGNPEQRSLADVLSEISALRRAVSDSDDRIAASLSSDIQRIEHRLISGIDGVTSFGSRRRSRRPGEASWILDMARSRSRPGGLLTLPIALSVFRDDAPWIYEVGMELYRSATIGNREHSDKLSRQLIELIDVSQGLVDAGPEFQELLGEVRRAASSLNL